MAYPHFKMLAKRLDLVEGQRAYYTYLAVNDPQKLGDVISQTRPQTPGRRPALDVKDFLSTVNGR